MNNNIKTYKKMKDIYIDYINTIKELKKELDKIINKKGYNNG